MTSSTRILSNDDGWILSEYAPPITVEQLRDNMVATYADSPIDTFLWNVGGREVFAFETHLGDRFAEGVEKFDDPAQQRHAYNLRHLIDHYGGPVTVISKLCRETGLRFFPSLRMNTHYNMDESTASAGEYRRRNTQSLIGRAGEEIPYGSLIWGLRTGKDYAYAQHRDFMNSIAFELLEGFDVDGLELDFMRHPGLFRPEQAYANRYLVTDMVRQLRGRMHEVESRDKKRLELSVRVASTLYDSERLGMEAERWIKEGLVDIVVTGLGFRPFNARVGEFVKAAEGTDCKILGCFEALRPVVQTEILRAIAARYWDDGADGLYFFNYFKMSREWKQHVVGELADPDALKRLDKIYEIDSGKPGNVDSQIGHAFRYCMPLEQLPVRLEETRRGTGARLSFELVDDFEGIAGQAASQKWVLGLGFQNLIEDDEVSVALNRQKIDWDERIIPVERWMREVYDGATAPFPAKTKMMPMECQPVEFAIERDLLRRGPNELEVRLVTRGAGSGPGLVLQDARVLISYNR